MVLMWIEASRTESIRHADLQSRKETIRLIRNIRLGWLTLAMNVVTQPLAKLQQDLGLSISVPEYPGNIKSVAGVQRFVRGRTEPGLNGYPGHGTRH